MKYYSKIFKLGPIIELDRHMFFYNREIALAEMVRW